MIRISLPLGTFLLWTFGSIALGALIRPIRWARKRILDKRAMGGVKWNP